ncbi:metalloprotease PmbA [Motilimonas eburnea]|uniref:metalloprotease PmbA n=1 Tax=Motilimonas eburnea TaxID=1737488 RepID=UPI001E338FA2|nr:metalloprotease PmbA [Motilimonas eburnea]MCE2572111.1 metalloprotease PmbA [Motilimonas eburnea]
MDSSRLIAQEQAQLKQAVADAVSMATKLGADQAEVAVSRQTGISVNTRMTEVENIEFNHDGALGISVYVDGRKGNSSTSDISQESIARAVQAAIEIAKHTSQDPFSGLADPELLERAPQDLDLFHPASLDPDEGLSIAKACEEIALNADSRIVNSDGASYSSHLGIKVYGNSHDYVQSYLTSRHSLSCVLIAQQGDEMQRDYSYTMARNSADLWQPEQVAKEAIERSVARLGARKIDTCSCPVLFSADSAVSLFGHLVNAISGGSLYRQSSFLLERLNTQVFPPWFNISERPHILGGLASSPYDAEGVKTQDRDIILNGDLNSYLLTSYSGRKLGMPTTGHAGGIHNWFVNSNHGDLQDMLRQLGTGLYVTELMGQGVNAVSGDYSRGAAGFWVENGEIAFPVHEVTIASNLKDMFMGIQAVGSDVDLRSSLRTGSVLIDNMKVAGS